MKIPNHAFKSALTAVLMLVLPLPVAAEMDHSAHRAMLQQNSDLVRTEVRYTVPDVELVNQDGEKVRLAQLLRASEPYALNFIFTTCSTICPILTSSFRQMQRELGDEAQSLQIKVSRMCEELDQKVQEFLGRELTGTWPYLWLDATYLGL